MALAKGHFVISPSSNWLIPGSASSDLLIGVANSNQSILFGASNNSCYFKMNSNGNIGIGTVTPMRTLDVLGAVRTNNVVRARDVIRNNIAFLAYRRSAAQSIINSPNPNPAVLFDSLVDSRGDHGLTYTSADGKFTNASGSTKTYLISYSLCWTTINTTGSRAAYIMLNGVFSATTRFATSNTGGADNVTCSTGTCMLTLGNNEYFTLNLWQNSGSSLNVGSDSYNGTLIQIQRL